MANLAQREFCENTIETPGLTRTSSVEYSERPSSTRLYVQNEGTPYDERQKHLPQDGPSPEGPVDVRIGNLTYNGKVGIRDRGKKRRRGCAWLSRNPPSRRADR